MEGFGNKIFNGFNGKYLDDFLRWWASKVMYTHAYNNSFPVWQTTEPGSYNGYLTFAAVPFFLLAGCCT